MALHLYRRPAVGAIVDMRYFLLLLVLDGVRGQNGAQQSLTTGQHGTSKELC